ncbi:hypothetical protein P8605_48115, partial [Streptomyces sp. T-3]|nr:hypothetical protein [Streptomyces sp. T-3]
RAQGLEPGERVEVTLAGAGAKAVRATEQRSGRAYLATRMTAVAGDPGKARVCWFAGDAEAGAEECFTG